MNESTGDEATAEEAAPRRRFRKRWILWGFLVAWACVGAWNTMKPMPAGADMRTRASTVAATDVQFLNDLTYAQTTSGEAIYEQRIFDEVFRIVDESESFIVADFFLLNDLMGASDGVHRPLSRQLADRLIARKAANPKLSILLVTDPINDVYAGMPSPLLAEMRSAGIDVVTTNLQVLRDSNPIYSSLWRMFGQWWGNSASGGSMMNPFTADASPITLRSWLSLLNFKANHRKVIVADRSDGNLTALVTSANPHDGSSGHSNVAIRFTNGPAADIVASEMAVARFSGWRGHIYASTPEVAASSDAGDAAQISYVTEKAIRDHLVDAIDTTRNGDAVSVATFYLSDRKVIDALLEAAARDVKLRLILDPNSDAFGRRKDGVPNRPVANELVTASDGKIEVRWYRTHGEQFHTKMALILHGERLIATLGSANLTRRNVGNYNLEANIAVDTGPSSPLGLEMTSYFDRLWNNDGPPGTQYTAPFGAYRDDDRARYWRYRLMEATGLSTF